MLNGLVESIRFGFTPINPPGVGDGAQFKTQSGLPPGGIRFGFKPRGSVAGTTGTGAGVPHYQAGLTPDAIRFGFKPQGTATQVVPVRHAAGLIEGGKSHVKLKTAREKRLEMEAIFDEWLNGPRAKKLQKAIVQAAEVISETENRGLFGLSPEIQEAFYTPPIGNVSLKIAEIKAATALLQRMIDDEDEDDAITLLLSVH
jgi:hypothetical protein